MLVVGFRFPQVSSLVLAPTLVDASRSSVPHTRWRTNEGRPRKHDIILIIECTTDVDENGESLYRLVVCNPGMGHGYHPVLPSFYPPKIKYKNSIIIKDIRKEKITDTAWWLSVLLPYATMHAKNVPDRLYEALSWLRGQPLEASLCETLNDPSSDWRSPQRANMPFYRSIREACHYLLRRLGVSGEHAKLVSYCLRTQFVACMARDLRNPSVLSLSDSDVRLLNTACQQLSYTAVKIAHSKDRDMSIRMLSRAKKDVEEVHAIMARKVWCCVLVFVFVLC